MECLRINVHICGFFFCSSRTVVVESGPLPIYCTENSINANVYSTMPPAYKEKEEIVDFKFTMPMPDEVEYMSVKTNLAEQTRDA